VGGTGSKSSAGRALLDERVGVNGKAAAHTAFRDIVEREWGTRA
jgi:hypothetical protein